MPDRLSETGIRYIRTEEAARLLGLSARTLEKYRGRGCGPIFRKFGGRVVYMIDDLESWADHATCRSTSDPRYAEMRVTGRLKTPEQRGANRTSPHR